MTLQGIAIVDDTFDDTMCGEWEIPEYGVAWEIRKSGSPETPSPLPAATWSTTHNSLSVQGPDVLRGVRTGDSAGTDEWRRNTRESGTE